ncbi:MAG TPA: peptidoglycan-associated lipoprotein Pal [Alphaproteobacteria bacterium]|nr:peptidoglycan-associated lipoprotein Pal [Alphaproteobacteria bacterium]
MRKVSMGLKLASMAAAVFLLAACESTPEGGGAGSGGGAGGGGGGSAAIVPGSQADLEATTSNRVFFGFDKYDLTEEARATLQAQAAWLAKNPSVTVTVAGNCDERGTREYNLALGERRANSAKDYLVSQGVDASRITTISYGKERPIALCSDESCWSQNRNATTTVN